MTQRAKSISGYYEHQPNPLGLVGRVSLHARRKMFETVMRLARPTAETSVLDVGVTADRREESNFFEKLYPHPERITAVGLEDASFLEQDFPGLKFRRTDGSRLPFADRSFDLVVSFAVIEHVGTRAQQQAFVNELCRVGRSCLVTTPNRWYPIEFHTAVPLLHWLPPARFRAALTAMGKEFYAREENLNLLTHAELSAMFPPDAKIQSAHYRLLGPVSNLLFYVQCEDK